MGIRLGDDVLNIIKGKLWAGAKQPPTPSTKSAGDQASAAIVSAVEYGIYGVAVWDPQFNLVTANRQYADLHKISPSVLKPGSNLRAIMHNLKSRGVLSPDTDPDDIMRIIESSLSDTGQITSYIRLSDDTVLSISAERMPNGNTASFMRNATRDKMKLKDLRVDAARSDAYVDAILKFPSKAENLSRRALASQLDEITRTVATLMETDWCVIWVRSSIINQAVSASSFQAAKGTHIEPETMQLPNLAGYLAILEASQLIAIDDLEKHAFGKFQGHRAPLDEHAHASLDTPFRRNGRIMGVLSCLDTHKARNWTAADKMFALSAASHIGNLLSATEESTLWDLPTGEIDPDRQAAE